MTKANTQVSRRNFLRMAAAGAGTLAATASVNSLAMGAFVPASEKRLKLFNTHTRERLDVVFWADGYYKEAALSELDFFLRDHRAEEKIEMDRQLYDLLWDIQYRTGTDSEFCIISGYRSPATNAKLRQRSGGVAQKSYHIVGQAIDIRLPEFNTRALRDIALSVNPGGVGYYAGSDFVHVDTGPRRSWNT